jgi:hypothetical protein
MKDNPKFDPSALLTSPMKHATFLLPQILLDHVEQAAKRDDPSCPNKSSWIRGALIQRLRREAA